MYCDREYKLSRNYWLKGFRDLSLMLWQSEKDNSCWKTCFFVCKAAVENKWFGNIAIRAQWVTIQYNSVPYTNVINTVHFQQHCTLLAACMGSRAFTCNIHYLLNLKDNNNNNINAGMPKYKNVSELLDGISLSVNQFAWSIVCRRSWFDKYN